MANLQQLQNLQDMLQAQMQPRLLVEFKAGILNLSGTRVTADKRRGKVRLVQNPDDGLLHLEWRQRPTDHLDPADDIVLTPNAAQFEKVPECKTGRVYLLRFRNSSRKRFFWMQEPKEDKDADLIKQMNDHIKTPPLVDGGAGGAGDDEEAQQQALLQMMGMQPSAMASGGVGNVARAAAAGRAAAATAAPGGPGGSNSMAAAQGQMRALAEQMRAQHTGRNSLTEILDADRVIPLLDDEMVKQLLPLLPEGQRTLEGLRQNLRSPQFKQALSRLASVLSSGNFGPVMASLGLSHLGNIGVPGFIQAIEADAKRQKEKAAAAAPAASAASAAPSAKKDDKKKDDDSSSGDATMKDAPAKK